MIAGRIQEMYLQLDALVAAAFILVPHTLRRIRPSVLSRAQLVLDYQAVATTNECNRCQFLNYNSSMTRRT
jgi:hypothetical protein